MVSKREAARLLVKATKEAAKEFGVPIESLTKTNYLLFQGWLVVHNQPKPEPESES